MIFILCVVLDRVCSKLKETINIIEDYRAESAEISLVVPRFYGRVFSKMSRNFEPKNKSCAFGNSMFLLDSVEFAHESAKAIKIITENYRILSPHLLETTLVYNDKGVT